MYTLTVKRSHSFTHGLHFINHHRWMTMLSIVALCWIVYALGIQIGDQTFFRFAEHSMVPGESATPLTLLVDPHYADEYDARVQYIYEQLGTLKDATGAERIYVSTYASSDLVAGGETIATVFEVVREGVTPQLHTLQGVPLPTWQHHIQEMIYQRGGVSSVTYSTELYNGNTTLIGAFGIEFMRPVSLLQENHMLERIRDTIRDIEVALSQPLEDLQES